MEETFSHGQRTFREKSSIQHCALRRRRLGNPNSR